MAIVLPAVLLPAGVLLLLVGYLAIRGRLARNRFAGVRTAETMRSEQAFRLANRIAAPTLLAAGVIAVLTGALVPLLPGPAIALMIALVAVVVIGVLLVTGGRRGHQVAELLNARQPPAPGGCGGCGCGAGGCQRSGAPAGGSS